ncbi:stage III sporulation protein AG [Paenibacillus arenosi]|uniref:Stage III sporulation protein AG n=1 Tax=Paenibacillus arenosi TaxID=2774142 RepID=A0ABR9AVJ6_9BACL|nr:stage III sporulation protein AG [Paenibacillus arenosi]MBD8497738.1 stage III sporulation protein AG [Paenibacillus arenosi]
MAKWLQKIESILGSGSNGPKRVKAFRWLLLLGLVGAALILVSSFSSGPGNGNWLMGSSGREPPAVTGVMSEQELNDSRASVATPDPNNPFATIEQSFETRMKSVLEEIVGVDQVQVMVTVDSTEELVIQRNMKDSQQVTEETDANGGKRHITQTSRDGEIVMTETSEHQSPIVTKRVKPKVRGVIVVAKGAENAVVNQMIVDAVEKGLNVPSYRISVVPRKISE